MDLGILAHLPLLFWVVFAASLALPYFLPRLGLVIGTIATTIATVFCLNDNADAFARHLAHQLGTVLLIGAGLWLVTSCTALVRLSRETAQPVLARA